ncbi:MAG TPA: sugar ABC transporter substrate-binding protein [Anaerolineaceae bacterium]|jgi:ribose transport system substrate-binding protein
MTKYSKLFGILVVLAMLLAACSPAAATTQAPAPTAAKAGGAGYPAQSQPTTAAPAAPATAYPAPSNPTAPAATTAPAASGGKPVKIAVIVKASTSDYWKIVGQGVTTATQSDPTITATFQGPNEETDIEGEIRLLEAAISAKVDAIAVAPSQADQVQPTLQKAVDAGIPVILIDTDIPNFKAKSAFVGTDNEKGGELAGDFIAKKLQKGDEVAIIRGAAGDPVHNVREQGAEKMFTAAGITVVAVQPADSDRAKGQSVAENLLTAHPNLKAIYATNDEMALGAATAAKAAGKSLIIVGFDASPNGLTAIKNGDLTASVAQFPTKIGELGTLTAAAVARGQKVDAFVNTGVQVVSKDNLSDFLK